MNSFEAGLKPKPGEQRATNVSKLAIDGKAFRRRAIACASGRDAIATFARRAGASRGDLVLCPAYVGWSPREGSGVLDPLVSLGLEVGFYRVGADLRIDVADLSSQLKARPTTGVILIHFFGHVDPNYLEIVRIIRESSAWCLEDEAHALLTDLVSGTCGRLGDASVLSLHKMLPISAGGALLVNQGARLSLEDFYEMREGTLALWEYDLARIANQRLQNAADISAMLAPLRGRVDPLWPQFGQNGEVPQTYPVVLRNANRDAVYRIMNADGYGVVTLYHTLVEGIDPSRYPLSHQLSRTILNLPIHQDLRSEQLIRLVAHLVDVLDMLGPDDRS